MAVCRQLPLPQLDALPLGAHRSLRVLTDEQLFASAGVRIAFTGRGGGVSEGPWASLNCGAHVDDDPEAVARNRKIVLEALGAPDAPLIVPSQVHGTNLVCVGEDLLACKSANRSRGEAQELSLQTGGEAFVHACAEMSESERAQAVRAAQQEADQGADGIVVPVMGVAALLNFADCLPVILVAPSGAFAVAHAGWRGALARIASKAAGALASVAGDDPSQINAYIGPHIRSECFEVSEDVATSFAQEFGEGVLAASDHVSLVAAVTADLVSAGVSPERIADAGICTKCNPDQYYSFRASGGRCGRHAAVAVRI